MQSVRIPDFFIVGAPKCGTTALYRYLLQHPEVYMPQRKEPHYFCPDLRSPRYVHDEAGYLALFQHSGDAKRVGEASVFYLYSKESAHRIKAFAPDADIIVMLRDPVAMIHSLHNQRLYGGYEDIADFAEAVAAEEDRRAGRRIPRHGTPVQALYYRQVGSYAAQVRRYLDVFGHGRVHVILHDDLVSREPEVYAGVCRFLRIDETHRPNFETVNPSKRIRSSVLRDLFKFSPAVKKATRRLLPQSIRQELARRFVSWNTRVEVRAPMPAELKRDLYTWFAPDVAELASLINRDLKHWMEPRSTGSG